MTFPPSKIQEVLERCYSRSSILLRLFIEEKRGMKRKLVNETFRIKEKSPSQSVFNDEQISCITEWRTNFVERKTIGKSTQIIESLSSANLNILKVWIPLMVYGYLLNISLDETVKDFTFYSRNRVSTFDFKCFFLWIRIVYLIRNLLCHLGFRYRGLHLPSVFKLLPKSILSINWKHFHR